MDNDAHCYGCLSTDRKLLPICDYIELYFNLLGDTDNCDLKYFDIKLCWECIGILKKIHTFQNRIKSAYFVLQQNFHKYNNIRIVSLSTLSTDIKENFDKTYEYNDQKQNDLQDHIDCVNNLNNIDEENLNISNSSEDVKQVNIKHTKNDIKEEDLKIENKDHDNEFDVFNRDNDFDDDDGDDDDGDDDSIPRNISNSEKSKLFGISIKRFEKMAELTTSSLDLYKREKYFKLVTLSEEEIHNIQERNRKRSEYLPFRCEICDNVFSKDGYLKAHLKQKHTKNFSYKCKQCKARFKQKSAMENHWMHNHKVFQCKLCPYVCQIKTQQSKHLKFQHGHNYKCKKCQECYGNLREFAFHYHHSHERLLCDHCSKTFLSKTALEKHMRRYHSEFDCKECNKKFPKYESFDKHMKAVHSDVENCKSGQSTELAYCVECNVQYRSIYKYKRHLATSRKHNAPKKKKEVPCPECGKVFSRTNYMKNHYKLFHEKKNKHYCNICDKYYVSGYSLRKHKRSVHDKIASPKDKLCNICGRAFGTNRILIHHIRTHTGERPHRCEFCTAAFSQITALRTHVRARHKQMDNFNE